MTTLTVALKTITPLFLGGADPDKCAELREPAIKAALRFWYRAIDPAYKDHEEHIFGSTDKGQASFLLRVTQGTRPGCTPWNPGNYTIPALTHSGYPIRPAHSSGNENTWAIDGLRYFSYPLNMGDNRRKAIRENSVFTLSLIFKNVPDLEDRRRILAAIWLLGHVGGLGTRSRRAFGTVALKSWNASNSSAWPELSSLPIAHGATTSDEWLKAFQCSLAILQTWFSRYATPYRHSVLGTNTRFKLHNTGEGSWYQALAEAGKAMQEFRQRYNLSDPNSDYHRVKKHLRNRYLAETTGTPGASVGTAALAGNGPDRAAFGLPLTFRYSSLTYTSTTPNGQQRQNTPNTTFQGQDHDRSASRIHVRIIQIGDHYHPLYIRLDGPLLYDREEVKEQRGGSATYPVPGDGILIDFWNSLASYREFVF